MPVALGHGRGPVAPFAYSAPFPLPFVPPIGPVVAVDSFNRADEVPMAGNWTQFYAAKIDLVGNKIQPTNTSSDRGAYWTTWTGSADQWSALKMFATSGGAGVGMGVVVRRSTSADTYYRVTLDNAGNYELSKLIAGAFTSLATGTISGYTHGKYLALSIVGTTLQIWYDWAQVFVFSDLSIATGNPGVVYSSTAGAVPTADDWMAGNTNPLQSGGLLTNLYAHYRLDEASGMAIDNHAGRHLANLGTGIGTAAGVIGSARDNVGTSGSTLSRSNTTEFFCGSNPFSFSFWFFADAFPVTNDVGLMNRYEPAGQREFIVFLAASGHAVTFLIDSGSGGVGATWGTAASLSTWYHVAGGWDGTNIKLSVNGGTFVTTAWSTAMTNGGDNFKLMYEAESLNGRMDDFSFWMGRCLTQAEVALLYNGGAGLDYNLFSTAVAAGPNAYTLPIAQGAFSLSGQPVVLLSGRLMPAVQGNYVLTGQTVNLSRGRPITIAQGVFTLTGQAVALLRSKLIAIAQGSYALTGQVVNLLRGSKIVIVQGGYVLTGEPVNLVYAPAGTRTIIITQGSYALTGQAVNLLRGRKIVLTQGAYSLTGFAVNLLRGLKVLITQGAYSLTGQAVILLRGRRLSAIQGAYSLAGQAINLLLGRKVVIAQGSYALTGQPVIFIFTPPGGEMIILTGQIVSGNLTGVTADGALTAATASGELTIEPKEA